MIFCRKKWYRLQRACGHLWHFTLTTRHYECLNYISYFFQDIRHIYKRHYECLQKTTKSWSVKVYLYKKKKSNHWSNKLSVRIDPSAELIVKSDHPIFNMEESKIIKNDRESIMILLFLLDWNLWILSWNLNSLSYSS